MRCIVQTLGELTQRRDGEFAHNAFSQVGVFLGRSLRPLARSLLPNRLNTTEGLSPGAPTYANLVGRHRVWLGGNVCDP
jgi:hypothetical protein